MFWQIPEIAVKVRTGVSASDDVRCGWSARIYASKSTEQTGGEARTSASR
jgi:hypothetical protein